MIRKTLLIAALIAVSSLSAFGSLERLLPSDLQDAKGNTVSRDSLNGKIIGLYFSAEWCPPCRAFTPELVNFRNQNKDNFEVVFVSSDRTPKEQKSYMANYKMDFLAVQHNGEATVKLREQFAIRGIPSLIIVDSKGNLITRDGRRDVSSNGKKALADWKKKAK